MNVDRTPRSVALASAALISLLVGLAFSMVVLLIGAPLVWGSIAALVGLAFLIGYFVIYGFIEQFLYRRVKIIYRTIHSLKTQGEKKPKIRMGADVLGQINSEVAEWAEEKIREVKELHATDSYRKEFIGNLAHELKTPLFAIQGYLETLKDGGLEDAEVTRRFLDRAIASCDRLADLIKDLDQITRYESGNMPLEISRFDVVALVRRLMESMEQLAAERAITLRLRNPNEKAIYVEADRSKIEQVISNLLINSINYGKESGETRIRFYDMADNILIEVADDGIGIAKEHQPRIFERFYRVDKSRSRNEGGSGLGLAICKHIIESHDQTISVRSTEGVGSTFSFTLRKSLS